MNSVASSCLALQPVLLPLHLVSDIVLAISYMAIGGAILFYLHKKKPTHKTWAYALLGFFLWCSFLHASSGLSYFYPIDLLTGIMKALTAVIVLILAIALFPLMPTLVEMLTPQQYEGLLHHVHATNQQLKTEVDAHAHELHLMENELTGRVRNILAVIHGISKETARNSPSIKTYLEKFNARLVALAHCHDLLLSNQWRGAPLAEVIHSQLEPYTKQGFDKVQLTGPDIFLKPNAVQQLSLAFSELAANAASYSTPPSEPNALRCLVSWYTHQDQRNQVNDTLRLSWSEPHKGTPPVTDYKGFGHVVLNYLVPTSLNGLSELRIQEQGIQWDLEVPMDSLCHLEAAPPPVYQQ